VSANVNHKSTVNQRQKEIPLGTRFPALPDGLWDPSRYRVFPGDEVRPGRATDHSPPSTVAVMEE